MVGATSRIDGSALNRSGAPLFSTMPLAAMFSFHRSPVKTSARRETLLTTGVPVAGSAGRGRVVLHQLLSASHT